MLCIVSSVALAYPRVDSGGFFLGVTRSAAGQCVVGALGVMLWLAPSPVVAQSAAEVRALRQEIEALKEGQAALRKEIAGLKAAQDGRRPRAQAPGSVELQLDRAPLRGSRAARVVLVEASDFECPFCGRHFRQTAQRIDEEYVQTGKVQHAWLNFPLGSHRNAFKAAEAGLCAADQGGFWAMHDRLFSNQTKLTVSALQNHAAAVGLDAAAFSACLGSSAHGDHVRSDLAMARGAGVTATPTFFVALVDPETDALTVVDRIVGAKPYSTFKASLDRALAAQ